MSFQWFVWSNPITLWWVFLVSVSAVNSIAWVWTRLYIRRLYDHAENISLPLVAVMCSGFYVFGCAFRSVIPRADVQRIVLFDTWFSSVFLGRTVATVAELAFVFQWALVLRFVASATNTESVVKIARVIVPLIVIAEICSWYAVVTTHYIGNSIEESLWTVTYVLIAIALYRLSLKLIGALRYAALIAVVGCVLYVWFMATVDVPMYLSRLSADMASGKMYLGFFEGIYDLNTRWIVTHDIHDWKTEIPWMSLYFSAAVWTSLALCYVPLTKARIAKHLRN